MTYRIKIKSEKAKNWRYIPTKFRSKRTARQYVRENISFKYNYRIVEVK